jgi:hypothetical protein
MAIGSRFESVAGVIERRTLSSLGDWGLPLLLAGLVGVASMLPYLYAYQSHSGSGQVFMGFFFLGDDANTYLAKMREGWEGTWLWTNRYSTEPGPGAYFFIFWIFLGHVAAATNLSLIVTFHLARLLGALALLAAGWAFIGQFVHSTAARRFAIWFMALGMGLGVVIWILKQPVLFGQQTDALDWRMPELSAFYSILALPHFAWVAAFQAIAVVLTLKAAESGKLWLGLLAGLAWLAESAIHAQMIILMVGALAIALAYRRASLRGNLAVILAFAICAPYVGYSYYQSAHSPEVLRWSAQWRNNLPPDGVSLLLALAPQLALACLALPGMWRRRSRGDVFLVAWLLLLAAILWLPNPAGNLRRRFFDGVYLPLVVMAALGLYEQVMPRLRSARLRRLVPFGYVAFSAAPSMFLLLAPTLVQSAPQYSVSRAEYSALGWLATQPQGAVLSSGRMGLYVPAYTPDAVYVGQYSETYNFFGKSKEAQSVLTGIEDAGAFAQGHGIRYILWSDEFGSGSQPVGLGEPAYVSRSPGGHEARVYKLY